MGQDLYIPAVPPKLMKKSSALSTVQPYSYALVTGAFPVGYYSLSLSTALISPFTHPLAVAIPPSATL
jgi:hypothetical protein